jgi:hypothetical protein
MNIDHLFHSSSQPTSPIRSRRNYGSSTSLSPRQLMPGKLRVTCILTAYALCRKHSYIITAYIHCFICQWHL